MFDNKMIDARDDHGTKIKGKKTNSGKPSLPILIFTALFFNLWWLFHFLEIAAPGLSILGWIF